MKINNKYLRITALLELPGEPLVEFGLILRGFAGLGRFPGLGLAKRLGARKLALEFGERCRR